MDHRSVLPGCAAGSLWSRQFPFDISSRHLFELVQISVCASLWLLLRTRLWRTFSQVSRGLRREAEILLDGPTDVERPA